MDQNNEASLPKKVKLKNPNQKAENKSNGQSLTYYLNPTPIPTGPSAPRPCPDERGPIPSSVELFN